VRNAGDTGLRSVHHIVPVQDFSAAQLRRQVAVCSPAAAKNFSAVGYFFGQKLRRDLKVPIGLVSSAVGARRSSCGLTAKALSRMPVSRVCGDERWISAVPPLTRLRWMTAAGRAGRLRPTTPGKRSRCPRNGERLISAAMSFVTGVVWVRKEVQIPDAWAGKDIALQFGPIDEGDVTYFNGQRIGASTMSVDTPDTWKTPRTILYGARRAGETRPGGHLL